MRVTIGSSVYTNSVEAGLITEGWCESHPARGSHEGWRIYGAYVQYVGTRYRLCIGKGGYCRSAWDASGDGVEENCNDGDRSDGTDLPFGRQYVFRVGLHRFRTEAGKRALYGRMEWRRNGDRHPYRIMRLHRRAVKDSDHLDDYRIDEDKYLGYDEAGAASETTARWRLMPGHYSGIWYRKRLSNEKYYIAAGNSIRRHEYPCRGYDSRRQVCNGRGKYFRVKFDQDRNPFCVFGPLRGDEKYDDCALDGFFGE
jgi:hypothetical protein